MANRSKFLQNHNIAGGITPLDLNGAAENADYISLKNYEGVVICLYTGVGTGGDDIVMTLQQATDVSDSGAKNLLFTDIYQKNATAGGTDLSAISLWTHTVQTAATNYTNAAMAENASLICIEIKASQLDTANNFDCLRLEVDNPGNAMIGCAFYILYGPKVATDLSLDAITD